MRKIVKKRKVRYFVAVASLVAFHTLRRKAGIVHNRMPVTQNELTKE